MCEKENLSPWCCPHSSFGVWLGTPLSPAMRGRCSLCCRFNHAGFVFISCFTCFKPQPLARHAELSVRELQRVFDCRGYPHKHLTCVSRRAPFVTNALLFTLHRCWFPGMLVLGTSVPPPAATPPLHRDFPGTETPSSLLIPLLSPTLLLLRNTATQLNSPGL